MDINTSESIKFEIVINEKAYTFYVPVGAPIGDALQACSQVLTGLTKLERPPLPPSSSIEEKGETPK